jgi:hypothetical protein
VDNDQRREFFDHLLPAAEARERQRGLSAEEIATMAS